MKVADLRPEFTVFVIDADYQQAESLIETIKSVGYDTHFYPTYDSAFASASQMPPHIVILNVEAFDAVADDCLRQLQEISPEILTLLMVHSKQVLRALQLISKGRAYDYIVRPFTSSLDLIQKIDRVAERLYFQFESEQLREVATRDRAHGNEAATQANDPVLTEDFSEDIPASKPPPRPLAGEVPTQPVEIARFNQFLERIQEIKELDPLVQQFMDYLSSSLDSAPVIYFKYLPHYMSLVVSHSVWLPIDKIRGIGFELKNESPDRLQEILHAPEKMEALRTLMHQAFKRDQYLTFSHFNGNEVTGLFVVFDPVEDPVRQDVLRAARRVFEICYRRNILLKEKHNLEIHDQLTQTFNRRFFRTRLDEEVSRARRTGLPLSLVILDIDGFKDINQAIGSAQADVVLRTVAMILKKTSRTNDLVARFGGDEIALLLPHTDQMGAAIKAERIRRIIESTRIPVLEGAGDKRVTISVGVSEYPSLCSDADSLVKSADEAMFEVKKSGGNKVCLATPPPNFQKDFEPLPVRDVYREKR